MANKTDVAAGHVHGTDPQYLITTITREKIYEEPYWKEKCFGLNAATLVDRAIELEALGGCYGGVRKPAKFLCLLLKMLQIQPDREIIIEFILNEDYPYVRLLGAIYLRLTGKSKEIYQTLEPILNDFRRIKVRDHSGKLKATHVDEVIDALLTQTEYLDITLPYLQKRLHLETQGVLEPRKSALEDMMDDEPEGDDSTAVEPTESSTIVDEAQPVRATSQSLPEEGEAEEGEETNLPTSSTATTSTPSTSVPTPSTSDKDRSSRHSSSHRHRDDSRDRDRPRSSHRDRSSSRDRDRHRSSHSHHRDRDRERERSSDRSSSHRHRERDGDEKERERDRDRDRHSSSRHHHSSSSSRSRHHDRSSSRDRERDRDRHHHTTKESSSKHQPPSQERESKKRRRSHSRSASPTTSTAAPSQIA